MDLQGFVGRTHTSVDTLSGARLKALAQTLDLPAPDAVAPPLWHWIGFPPDAATRDLRPDGHPVALGVLPPLPLPRRMWAGGRLKFRAPLPADTPVERRSTLLRAEEKSGRAGPMALFTIAHELRADGVVCIEEEQDVVYLPLPEAFAPPPPQALPEQIDFEVRRALDPALLFRFSACTFNAHRIHYDRTYAMEVEKYPGLVVHGPLQAILAMEAARARDTGRTPAAFEFRGVRPLFDFDELRLAGVRTQEGAALYAANGEGAVTMAARVGWT